MINVGIVKKIENNDITLHFYKDSSCAHCSACSPSKKMGTFIKISTEDAHLYSVGDELSVELEDTLLLKLSFITYIIPPIFMILGYLLLNSLNFSDKICILGSFLFLIISFVALYFYDKTRVKEIDSSIKIIGKVSSHIPPSDNKSGCCGGH